MATGNLDLDARWGPFSSSYLGVSRIMDAETGAMADLALYAGRVAPVALVPPDSIFGYEQHMNGDRRAVVRVVPEDAAPDYSSFALRYYLDGRGDTALARFTVESDARARCSLTFYNTSAEERAYFYGFGLLAGDPRKRVTLKEALRQAWLPARDYTEIEAYQKVFGMGSRQCLTRVFSWGLEDAVLAQAFGGWPGDRVVYRMRLPSGLRDGFVYFRFVKYGEINHDWELRLNGRPVIFQFPQTWPLRGGQWGKNRDALREWRLLAVPVGAVAAGEVTVELRSVNPPGNDRARIWLDGLLFSEGRLAGDAGAGDLLPTELVEDLSVEDARVEAEGTRGTTVRARIILPGAPARHAAVEMDSPPRQVRSGRGSFLADLRRRFELPPVEPERDASAGPWAEVEAAPVTVPAHSEHTVHFTLDFETERPAGFAAPRPATGADPEPTRGPYAPVVARLRDALVFNINYPLALFGRPSHYFVPAKYFPLPYSWDGGFVALGLATFAPEPARRQASFFFADRERDFPFVYCGSPVPTQLYALWDIYQATQDTGFLARVFDGARRMYDFYLGRTPGSEVNLAGDGLLSTYRYNYNLGIDDHPIQRRAEEEHLTRRGLYSIILMPQVLRCARIMRNIAELLGRPAEAETCRRDAELLAGVIETRMWDESSGLYGWLTRDEQGAVKRFVLDGCAGDRSACAFLPLFAGQAAHRDRLVGQMLDPARFNTPYGISSVDMSAPSYNPAGYWNGAVWPVMQWYIWRGLLETGEPALARRVAETILATWQGAFDREHYLGEHYVIARGEMMGTPNFGGLSAVLLAMHAAYFTAYRVTTAYDVAIIRRQVNRARDELSVTISAPFLTAGTHDMLVNMGRGSARYAVRLNGKLATTAESDEYGHLTLRLPRPDGAVEVLLSPAGS